MQTLKIPTAEATEMARVALRSLAPTSKKAQIYRLCLEEESVTVPREAFELFLEILGQIANGNAVTLIPVHAELTTQQASEILNVSRPYLIGLLEEGKIPYRMVGTHRRIRMEHLMAYRDQDDALRKGYLDELTQEAEKLGLGY